MWETLATVRDLGRVQEIASVLVRYGFGDVVQRIGMAGALERAGRLLHIGGGEASALRLSPPERVRHALQDLGPTFVKLGQVLATRVDLLPPEWIDALGRLQSQVPAVPIESLRAQLEEDLGAPPEHVFARIDTTPIGSASLAQVHRAWLHDGTAVVLKIRKPGIRPVVEADLRLLARLAELIEAELPELRRYHPVDVTRQFTQSLRRELDFAAEGRNSERVAANFADQPDIIIPRVHWTWTCERLNVQDAIDGIPGSRLDAVDAAGFERHTLARRGTQAVLKMMLEDGLFHADPHPGNVFYLPGERLAFIDFGMVGRLTAERRAELATLLYGLVRSDGRTVADVLLDWSETPEADPDRLQNEVEGFVDQYRGVSLKNIDLAVMLGELFALLRDHHLTLPADLALMLKAVITLDGLGRQLVPDFDTVSEAAPFVERALLAQAAPRERLKRGWRSLSHTLDLAGELPQDLRHLLRAARRGKLRVEIDVLPLRRFGNQVDRAVSRLSISVVTAALIIGSAIVMAFHQQPGIVRTFGMLGFFAALTGGLWVLFSIWRGGRGE